MVKIIMNISTNKDAFKYQYLNFKLNKKIKRLYSKI